MSRPWETDFVAVCAALGEPAEAVAAALGSAGLARAGALAAGLQAGTRASRVILLATALAGIREDLDEMELRE